MVVLWRFVAIHTYEHTTMNIIISHHCITLLLATAPYQHIAYIYYWRHYFHLPPLRHYRYHYYYDIRFTSIDHYVICYRRPYIMPIHINSLHIAKERIAEAASVMLAYAIHRPAGTLAKVIVAAACLRLRSRLLCFFTAVITLVY